jgi:hypothetical protein
MLRLVMDFIDAFLWKRIVAERLERYARRSAMRPSALAVRVRRHSIGKQ